MTNVRSGIGQTEIRSHTRRGISLLDALGVILTTGILLSFAATVLSQAFRSHADALDHLQRMRQLQTAGDRFRADVHAAISARVEDDHLLLDSGQGRTIRYDSSTSPPTSGDQSPTPRPVSAKGTLLLTRTMSEGGQEFGREQVPIAGSQEIRWTIQTDESVPLVRCELIYERRSSFVWLSRLGGSERSPGSMENIPPTTFNDKEESSDD